MFMLCLHCGTARLGPIGKVARDQGLVLAAKPLFVHVAQVVFLKRAIGVELERKKPADVPGSSLITAGIERRMEVHNTPLEYAPLSWQLRRVRRAEDRIHDSHRTTSRDYRCINRVEAHGPYALTYESGIS